MKVNAHGADRSDSYCEGCDENRAIATLVFGDGLSGKRMTLCQVCLVDLHDGVQFAIAKYGKAVRSTRRAFAKVEDRPPHDVGCTACGAELLDGEVEHNASCTVLVRYDESRHPRMMRAVRR